MALTPVQLQTLHDDILTHSALDGIARTPDGDDEIATYYATTTVDTVGQVLIADVLIWAAQNDRYAKLVAATDAADGIGSICQVALITLNNPQVPNLDLGDATIVSLFDALVTADILTTGDQDDLVALATHPISLAQSVLGVPRITYVDVGLARALS